MRYLLAFLLAFGFLAITVDRAEACDPLVSSFGVQSYGGCNQVNTFGVQSYGYNQLNAFAVREVAVAPVRVRVNVNAFAVPVASPVVVNNVNVNQRRGLLGGGRTVIRSRTVVR